MKRTIEFCKVFEYEVEVDENATVAEIVIAGETEFTKEMTALGVEATYDDFAILE